MKSISLIWGASLNPQRHSYKAIISLLEHGFQVAALGFREGEVAGVKVHTGFPPLKKIHTVNVYLKADEQEAHEDYIIALKPKRIIFNKKTLNPQLVSKARLMGIQVLEDCTLVLLAKGLYEGD